ncbi:NAD(P)-dependent oxidoreductase [Kaistia dalseonensis]|uniref:Nucleoside-diphosphate-sugar epimerase n=1 Tax=Kaistia dalseonensis TaxID=410840 RepID=A0ABU0H7H0_9HYPH|nr:NAD(P)-dependent oxidoreductase [Kaistia dalseonensis]MCX5495262.1 NAD(P)-dependent oxidoreductase [Kaistia dalseonensis]MDQ0437848.1 nucleoside-diphosphate-sugar epimerase [Kaistia dalseonensis]
MIVVTGGSGLLGRAVVKDLVAHGYDVTSIDFAPQPAGQGVRFSRADLTDYGQAIAALSAIDERVSKVTGIVHLAAIPAPGLAPNHVIFETNMISTYNVFEAARVLGIRNVVWASSETVLGLPFDTPPPYVPVDEDYRPRPESAYSLSKFLSEEMAKEFVRWDPSFKIFGLRFSNIMAPEAYAKFPSFEEDVLGRKWNLWAYIDARDAAQAVRLALESPLKGAEAFIIANEDGVMSRPNDELLDAVFPGVPRKREFGPNDTLLAIDKAKSVLGYAPKHSWRDMT